MHGRFFAAFILPLLFFFPTASRAVEDGVTKIVLIPTKLDHPWATHMYSFECATLARCLNQTPGVEAKVSPDFEWPKDPALTEEVDVIVFYSRSAGDIVLAPDRKEAVRALLDRGVGFTGVHWSTATDDAKLGADYLDILGGWFHFDHSGLAVEEQNLTQIEADHPVCRGWDSYPIYDEFYLDLKFHENAKPLLKVAVEGKDQTVAWAFDRADGGRSFGTTLGHFHKNFVIEDFRKMIVNGILWTARLDIPQEGAPVKVSAQESTLPDPSKEK